jgi:hypothetical protein
MNYYKSKADRSMTQLSEAYGQIVGEREIVSERTIASYEGGTKRVVQEILGALAGAAALGAAGAVGGKAIDAVTGPEEVTVVGNEDQEQEDAISIGMYVDIDESKGGGTGEITGIVSDPADTFVIETDDGEVLHLHYNDLTVIRDVTRPEDRPGTHTAGRVGGV